LTPGHFLGKLFQSSHLHGNKRKVTALVGMTMLRAALTGKHDTLVRRASGWQGAPDGQQAKN